ncbi:MAG TPA: glycosyltransferase [Chitinophagaceae bacterium]|nr:glycosyltransferase [Chitinophagaceae bacterium]
MQTVVSLVPYQFLPAKVGGQRGIALFNKYFAKHVRLVCVTVKSNDASKAEGYEVRNELSTSPLRYINPLNFFRLKRILKETNASLLLIEHPYYGWLGTWLKRSTGIPLAVHSHNIEGLRFKTIGKWWWKILWRYERFTHRQADYNFFIHDQDREFAIQAFGLQPERCITMTYGIEWSEPPARTEMEAAGQRLRSMHNIASDEYILLFNGAFNYKPNLDALKCIIQTIDPLLQQQAGFKYRIIVCGRDIPEDILNHRYQNIIVPGFVDDINLYFRGADVFINPVTEGGGIKTKLVEALGHNLNAVSTENGAIGVNPALCNGKLLICGNEDWEKFAANVVTATKIRADTPPAYFKHFYWGYSVESLVRFLKLG